jgi:hypothetical protein
MYKLIVSVLIPLVLASCVLQIRKPDSESLDQQAVRQAFYAYKYALLNNLGKEAADLVSKKTLARYAQLKNLALTGTREQLDIQPPFKKMVALNLRHNISGRQIEAMTAKDLFAYGVKEEWISKDTVAPYELGTVKVYGNYASAVVLYIGQTTDNILEFLKEDGAWRINLVPLLNKADQNFSAYLNQYDANYDDVIVNIIESTSGRKVNGNIWEPIKKKSDSAKNNNKTPTGKKRE